MLAPIIIIMKVKTTLESLVKLMIIHNNNNKSFNNNNLAINSSKWITIKKSN